MNTTSKVLVLLAGVVIPLLSASEEGQDFEVDFSEDAILSPSEIKNVVKVANAVGIKEVALIRTIPIYPGGARYLVLVNEEATEDEGYLNYRQLAVQSKRLEPESWERAQGKFRPETIILDGFASKRIRDVRSYPLEVGNKTIEILVSKRVEVDYLKRALKAIEIGAIEIEFVDQEPPDGMPWEFKWPGRVRSSSGQFGPDRIKIDYPRNGSGVYFYAYLHGETLVIIQWGMWRA